MTMIKRIKELWHNPRDIEEAEAMILFGLFATLWMWMVIMIW